MAKPIIDYTSKDYEAFRNDMINLIPRKLPEYTDFSQSDAGIMLIELLAYGLDILSYYQDRNANETYLGTATQRGSVIDVTKQLSYRLRNAVPASALVVFRLSAVQGTDFVIPKGFVVSTEGTVYEEAINFETVADLIIPRGALGDEQDEEGNYLYKVKAVQGLTITNENLGASNGQPLQRFKLKYTDVIDGETEVSINEGTGYEAWTDVTTDPVGATVDGKHYTRETDENGYTWVVFGDGLSGKVPAIIGETNIKATYRIGGGSKTNVGANTIIKAITNLAGIKAVMNPTAATGGLDRESIREAKINAPKLFKTQSRAVTGEDYENIAISVPGVAKSRAVKDQSLSNTVHVTIAPVGGGQPTAELVNNVFQLLDDTKVITTQVFMESPKYIHCRVSVNIQLDDEASRSEVQTYILEGLKSVLDFSVREFGQGIPIARLYRVVMDVDGIYSAHVSRVTVRPLIEWTSVSGNPVFNDSDVQILPANSYDGLWKVRMKSATAFEVFHLSYDTQGDEVLVPKGSGTLGTLFTSTDNTLSFKITAGTIPCSAGDSWRFRTSPYLADITVADYEILLLDEADLVLNITGGRE